MVTLEPVSAWGGTRRGGQNNRGTAATQAAGIRRAPTTRQASAVGPSQGAGTFYKDAKTQREPADTRAQLTPGPGLRASRSVPWMAAVLQRPTVANSHREATGSPGRPSFPCRRRPHTGRGRAVSVPRADVRAQRPAPPRACSSAGSGAESGARPDVLGGAEDWGASGIRACARARLEHA